METRHCFSFGRHYDPVNVAFGPLLLHDEHLLAPGEGFGPHPHRDLEIVSWVLEGALVHEDGSGATVVPAGVVQRMTAGSGVVHAERAGAQPTRFVQVWLAAAPGRAPSYRQVVVPAVDGLVEVVAGVHVGALAAGREVTLAAAPYVHVFVASGSVVLDEAGALARGDSARLTAAARARLRAVTQAQVLVVAAHSGD